MHEPLPSYYTRLTPFRRFFATGVPILTYHKFGPRPRRTRLGGLYLPAALLRRQLKELRAAGFAGANVGDATVESAELRVIVTIDDGFQSATRYALPLLERFKLPATLYLVADRLGGWNDWEVSQGEVAAPLMEPAEVREWLAAGHRVGSHSLTHPWLTRISVAAAREELRASRKRLEDLFGVAVTDFCYPYGDWNTIVRDEVQAAGYVTATTTDFGVNNSESDPRSLRRITARHTSWNFRRIRGWWRRWRRI